MKRLRVGVLYGGRSGEHEVSVASAATVFAHIDRQRYEPIAIRIEKDGRWTLADRPPSAASAADVIEQLRTETARVRSGRDVFVLPYPGEDTLVLVDRRTAGKHGAEIAATLTGLALDVLFPVLHGPYGEDGTLQGLLELADVPYVGCGVLASATGMDKSIMKILFRARDLRVSEWQVLTRREWRSARDAAVARIAASLPFPVFVKPASLGSSLGISKVHDASGLAAAIDRACEHDRKIVIEAAVPNAREIECAVLGNEAPDASVPGEIIPSREFYDYQAKYLDDGQSRVIIPAPLPPETIETVRRQSLVAFQAIDGAGLARVDFLLDGRSGDLFVNEINTLPGFTTISMFSKLWQATNVDMPTVIDRLIGFAIARHAEKHDLHTPTI